MTGTALTPRNACCTLPLRISWATTPLTVLIGIAKPMPTLPPDSFGICALTPITWPRALSSGPPELPWLMAASVWMTWSIVNPFGASIVRCTALTIPAVAVRVRLNGLPIATTASPT